MPAEFQKAIDLILTNCTNTYAYLDDILIVTMGFTELHQQELKAVLDKLDEENLAISLEKCKFACKQIEWLGFNINSDGTTPLTKKTEAIEKLSLEVIVGGTSLCFFSSCIVFVGFTRLTQT